MREVRKHNRLIGTVEDGVFTSRKTTFDKNMPIRLRDMRVRTLHIGNTYLSLADAVRNGKITDDKWIINLDYEQEMDTTGAER